MDREDDMPLLRELNTVQRDAVKAIDGPVMIVAGAGSGKTRVLTYRIAYLLQCGVPAYNVLALTFTNKAAREMRERIVQLVQGDEAQKLWMGTFHSTFARLLRRDAERLGFTKNFTIYDTEDSRGLIKTILADFGASSQQFLPAVVQSHISKIKNRMIKPADFANTAKDVFEMKVAGVYEEYQKRLQRANAMDFDDLLLHPIALFDQNADVLERYQQHFRFILIDEYQDTNHAQYQLIQRLASSHQNICVVGDDAQSIYAFRGADIRNILDFEQSFTDVKIFRLEQNYRSTKTILKGADALIAHNSKQIRKSLWTDNDTGDLITALEAMNEQDEALRIVRAIQEEGMKRKLQLRDFAVLYRANAQSRAIEDALRRSGIPYVIVGGVAFYRRKEIKDVLAYLRLIVNPDDDEAFSRVINYPSRKIGQTTLDKLREKASSMNLSLYRAASESALATEFNAGQVRKIESFVLLLRKYLALRAEMSAGELAGSLIDELGIVSELKAEGTVEARSRIENIQELLSALSEYRSSEGFGTLEAFLAEASLVADVDQMDGTRNAVTLMTLHAAKGLEYPVVFLTGMEEGVFPSSISIEEDQVEEERRLCYVGMTRAMVKLYVTHTIERTVWGERTRQMPSRFLDEIDQTAIERQSVRKRQFEPAAPKQRSREHWERRESYSQESHDSYSQIEHSISEGALVRHATFGRGKVLTIQGAGDMTRVVVVFESVGKKTLILKFAGLSVQ